MFKNDFNPDSSLSHDRVSTRPWDTVRSLQVTDLDTVLKQLMDHAVVVMRVNQEPCPQEKHIQTLEEDLLG